MKATTEGVIRFPISFVIISTCPFLYIPTQEYVVPKSIPITGHSTFAFLSSYYKLEANKRVANKTLIIYVY